jgi:hypothetical protein
MQQAEHRVRTGDQREQVAAGDRCLALVHPYLARRPQNLNRGLRQPVGDGEEGSGGGDGRKLPAPHRPEKQEAPETFLCKSASRARRNK